jgi:hypothetical protein
MNNTYWKEIEREEAERDIHAAQMYIDGKTVFLKKVDSEADYWVEIPASETIGVSYLQAENYIFDPVKNIWLKKMLFKSPSSEGEQKEEDKILDFLDHLHDDIHNLAISVMGRLNKVFPEPKTPEASQPGWKEMFVSMGAKRYGFSNSDLNYLIKWIEEKVSK